MKNLKLILSLLMAFGFFATALVSCSDDDDGPSELKIVTMTANDVDLNGATSPNNVAANATITATFNADVDPLSATADNVKLVRDYDKAVIATDLSVAGKSITIDPKEDLASGALYILTLGSGLTTTKGKPLTAIDRNFTTAGTFAPSGVIAHWTFENTAEDVVGSFDPTANQIVAIAYNNSRNTAAGKAATFNGTSSIIEVSNGDQLMNTHDWTLSFWVRATHANAADTRGHFVMGLGAFYGFQWEIRGGYTSWQFPVQYEFADGTTGAEAFNFSGDGKSKDNGGWQGFDFVKDLTGSGGLPTLLKDKWAHVVYTYESATKKAVVYVNGEKMTSLDFNLWNASDKQKTTVGLKYAGAAPDVVNELAFGFVQSRAGTMWDNEDWGGYDKPGASHFEGMLDDIRFFKKPLTSQEVSLMYNSEKP